MKCENCGREHSSGHYYNFYYGTKSKSYRRNEVLAAVTQTNYEIKGQRESWICNFCVYARLGLSLGVLLLLAFGFSLFIYPNLSGSMSSAYYLPLSLITFGIYFLTIPPHSRTELGDLLAIRVNKKALKGQGYNAFLTTGRHKKLSRRR
jgi:hypothetical protein